jgi:thioesterase domain-containing protein
MMLANMDIPKFSEPEFEQNGDQPSVEKLRSHLAMLDALQPEVDSAIDQLQREIDAMSAEARYCLKSWEERIDSHGEAPSKFLRKMLERIEEKQENLSDAHPDDTLQFLRYYHRYLRSILRLSSES